MLTISGCEGAAALAWTQNCPALMIVAVALMTFPFPLKTGTTESFVKALPQTWRDTSVPNCASPSYRTTDI